MKVLIYGASGFIGKHLVKRLQSDVEVLTFDRHPCVGTTFAADIKDAEAVASAMSCCNRWVNLAGLLGTSELIMRAQDAVDVNITGALNVYNAGLNQGNKPGLQISVGNYWMCNPYSITKSAAERLALLYSTELGATIYVVRGMNVFGPGQKAWPIRKLIPNVIIPALNDETVTVYGDGEQIMDMIYVKDAVEILARIILQLPQKEPPLPKKDEVLEAGAGPITVNEIVQVALEIIGKGRVKKVPMRPGEESRAVVQISRKGAQRLKELIGFDITNDCTPFRKAMEETVAWYKTYGGS